ncbi:MAG: PIN domain-containing protein [Parvularculaceae bacterium]
MIYVDSSAVLAELLAEDRRPGEAFWRNRLIASRLLAYEVVNRLHNYGRSTQTSDFSLLLLRIELVDLTEETLSRALEPFPVAVRSLDGLHLATIAFIRQNGRELALASYDKRMLEAAAALGVIGYPL